MPAAMSTTGGTGRRTRCGTGGRPWSRSRRLSRCRTMLHGLWPARRSAMGNRTGRVATPRRRRRTRREHDSRLPGVHDNRILHDGGLLRRFDARAVAVGADGRAVGMRHDLHAVTDRAKRSVDLTAVHPGPRRHAPGRQNQRRSCKNRQIVLVHRAPPFYDKQGG